MTANVYIDSTRMDVSMDIVEDRGKSRASGFCLRPKIRTAQAQSEAAAGVGADSVIARCGSVGGAAGRGGQSPALADPSSLAVRAVSAGVLRSRILLLGVVLSLLSRSLLSRTQLRHPLPRLVCSVLIMRLIGRTAGGSLQYSVPGSILSV